MHKHGYWSVVPDQRTDGLLYQLCLALDYNPEDNEFPFHVTLANDETNPEQTAEPDPNKTFRAQITGFELFGKNEDVLVALLHSPDLAAEHKRIHADGSLTSKYPEYRPHVTLVESGATQASVDFLTEMVQMPISVVFENETAKTAEE